MKGSCICTSLVLTCALGPCASAAPPPSAPRETRPTGAAPTSAGQQVGPEEPEVLRSEQVPEPNSLDLDQLYENAEAFRRQRRFAESAALYDRIYRSRSEAMRGSLDGELDARNASRDYQSALSDEAVSLELLEAHAALLEDFVARRAAVTDGREVPEDLAAELESLRERIATARAEDALESEPTPAPETSPPPRDAADREAEHHAWIAKRRSAWAILSVGIASTLGGGGLLVGGAVNLRYLETRDDRFFAALDTMDYTPEERAQHIASMHEPWHARWRGVALAQLIGGATLAAMGVGLTTWGSIRLRRSDPRGHRGAAVVLEPLAGLGYGGLRVRY